jgi:hypothetical protein
MTLSRQETLKIIQQVHAKWWSEHPEIEPGELGNETIEHELLERIKEALEHLM